MTNVTSELDQYNYNLPKHLIAQEPMANRADARLMVVDRAQRQIMHQHVRDLPELLRPGDCLVLNDTRVIPARLVGYRMSTKGRWEGLYLNSEPSGAWQVLCKARGKLAPGETIQLLDRLAREDTQLRLIAKSEQGVWLVRPSEDELPIKLLERIGRVPLPKYIRHGEMVDADLQRYQTVYAKHSGSVAAPTAGLHFTAELLDRLQAAKIGIARVTLHVGMDTFRPIKAAQLDKHAMHSEWGQIDATNVERINLARKNKGRIVAVGTTSVRVLETAAADGVLRPWEGQTQLFIRPPYRFRAVDCLLTNFHLPSTTLLVLVRAFGGDKLMQSAYEEAVRNEYRFYSYGDAMLIV
ncbi:MAG TPA: tRNA preQ1(34) S-adenosylmethionine ribosyltransferase-isomerase QueA [Pirellulales bacterium]|nr:tRNA preQ1(34) S-adenosylmethionine ribosyltransferase-isomerase QueA [Pirellulales bacterium]